jgi:hypothetical protein
MLDNILKDGWKVNMAWCPLSECFRILIDKYIGEDHFYMERRWLSDVPSDDVLKALWRDIDVDNQKRGARL